MKQQALLLATMALAAGSLIADAQTPTPQNPPIPHVTIEPFSFGPPRQVISDKANAPFSAVVVEQVQQTFSDGTSINRETRETVMRDGAGRIYRARELKSPGHIPHSREPRVIFTISDPVEHVEYSCTPLRTCTKFDYRAHPMHGPSPDPRKMRDVTVEDLGPSNISGVVVEGERVTRIIPEGSMGNDRPITTTEEVWRSKELDAEVQKKHVDPIGTRTATMTEINLAEPAPAYFKVPEGYKVRSPAPFTGASAPLPPTAQ